jgi:SAM-dependent methyltransferase
MPQPLKALRRRAFELLAPRLSGGEPLIPPAGLHAVGDSDFRATGEEFLRLFLELAELRPGERVLDVGCGVGRIARPLAGYLSPAGSYAGFDVSALAIRWCRRHYAPYANFAFTHVDAANTSYNPGGAAPAETLSFPYPDASFDFAILTSVFTHMLAPAVERYISELARVLAPGGRALVTFFLLNEESLRLIGEGRSSQAFGPTRGPVAIVDPAQPEAAVAFEERWALERLSGAGLPPRLPIRYGSWCGRERHTSYQDIVIADRAG